MCIEMQSVSKVEHLPWCPERWNNVDSVLTVGYLRDVVLSHIPSLVSALVFAPLPHHRRNTLRFERCSTSVVIPVRKHVATGQLQYSSWCVPGTSSDAVHSALRWQLSTTCHHATLFAGLRVSPALRASELLVYSKC